MNGLTIALAVAVSALIFFIIDWLRLINNKKSLHSKINQFAENVRRLEESRGNLTNQLELANQKNQFLNSENARLVQECENLKSTINHYKEKERENSYQLAKAEAQLTSIQSQLTRDTGIQQLPSLLVEQNENLKQMFAIVAKLQNDVISAQRETISIQQSRGALENVGKGLDQIATGIKNWLFP